MSAETNDAIKKKVFCIVNGFEIKESENGNLIRGGYIATTHLDSGFYDSKRDVYVRDRISKETLEKWAEEINQGVPRANKVSVNHNRIPHVAGVGIKGTARVDYLPDGEYGLYADTLVDKTREDFEDIKYRLDNGLLDSFSIEILTKDPATGNYLMGIQEMEQDNMIIRSLGVGTQLEGWTLASQPMNEHAVMIKEIIDNKTSIETKEDDSMAEEEQAPVEAIQEDAQPEEVQEEPQPTAEEVAEEVKECASPKKKKEVKEEDEEEESEDAEEEKESISKEDLELLKEVKEQKAREAKELEKKEIMDSLKEEFKETLKSTEIEVKGKMSDNNDNIESKEMREYKEVISNKEMDVSRKFRAAGALADSLGLFKEAKTTLALDREYKNFTTNGTELEYKGLGVSTNSTDYDQSAAELSDVYDPIIYQVLNQKTKLWNFLEKDDFSMKGNNQVQFVVKSVANPTAGAYTGNAVNTGNVGREKNQTKFKKYAVGVEVDGDMIAAARGGPIGDVFSKEVEDSTVDLLSEINKALFAEVGAETAAGIIGLPYLTDAAGNTSLYGLTRANFDYMDGNSGATYINASSANISLKLMRQAIRQAVESSNSDLEDLFWVCDWTQYHKLIGIYDAAQRLVPTSSRFGFEGRPEVDGVPVVVDKDCKSGSWFLVDKRHGYRVAVWVPPTLEMLGKDADSMKGFIKTYFATYSRMPNSCVEIYGASTS